MRWLTISILMILVSVSALSAQTPAKPPVPPQTKAPAPAPAKAPAAAPVPAAAPAKAPAAAAAPPAQPAPPAAQPGKPALNALDLGQEWVDRLNALDDWHLSMDGKEVGLEPLVDSFMERMAPDVLAEVPPYDEEQIGPVMLIGTKQVREWVEQFARSEVELRYLLKRQTQGKSEAEPMVFTKVLPWGGLGVSFPIIAYYGNRWDRKRYIEVGSAFIHYRDDGKIERFRLYLSEKEEVVGGRNGG